MLRVMAIRTKVVCTVGPAVASLDKIVELMKSGMSVARLNFGHGTYEEHAQMIGYLKKAREKLGLPLAIMIDIKGPEVRIGKVKGDAMPIAAGQRIRIPQEVPMHPLEVLQMVTVGMRILFDDGYLISKVVEKDPSGIVVEMLNAGTLKSGKGMNIPGAQITLPAMTPKDVEDLKFACKHEVEMIAASFIRSSHHVLSIKEFLAKEGHAEMLVVSKIENHQGIENFDSIVQASDGIMIARGDLGLELDLALVPKLQKMMIRKCFQACKPSIIATQMLESMITYPRPTRAEVSDVANGVYDCTSAIMLSGETAVGKYPIETTLRMCEIAKEAEEDFDYRAFFERHSTRDYHDISSAVSLAAVKTAYSANAKAIFAFTTSGMTAKFLSRLMPKIPIIALTTQKTTYHQMAFYWGVIPLFTEKCANVDEAFALCSRFAMEKKIIAFGDVVVVTSGIPFGKKGSTNMMHVQSVGDILVRGHKGFGRKVTGPVSILLSPEGRDPSSLAGHLVVIPHCDAEFLPLLKGALGLILQNSINDHNSEKYAALVAKTFDLPLITRADGALATLTEGEEVTLDPHRGLIYRGSDRV